MAQIERLPVAADVQQVVPSSQGLSHGGDVSWAWARRLSGVPVATSASGLGLRELSHQRRHFFELKRPGGEVVLQPFDHVGNVLTVSMN